MSPCVHRGRWWLPRRTLVVSLTVLFTLVTSVSAGGAALAAPAAPAVSAANVTPHHGGCGQLPTVEVFASGIPRLDRPNLQHGIDIAQAEHGCALLIGHFALGICVVCVRVTQPVTISGEVDPNQNPKNPRITVISTSGGVGSIFLNESSTARPGTIEFRDLWVKQTRNFGFLIANVYNATVKYFQNRVTDIRGAHFRVGIGGSGEIPIVLPRPRSTTGKLIVTDNYINTTAVPFPLPFGDDNGFAVQGTHFRTIDVAHNTVSTFGESIEIEKSVGSNYRIADNTVVTKSRIDSPLARAVTTVGYPRLHGGHPAELKLSGNDVANFSILNNHLAVGGGSNTLICIMQYMSNPETSVHRQRSTRISGNTCVMKRIFAGLLGGWSGENPYFPQGTLDNAVVTNNTFSGTADFGITMMDFKIHAVPKNDLINTSNHDVFTHNNLSGFTAIKGGASLYFGPATHNNTFIGNPHGPVVNLGKHNRIIP